MIQDANTTLLYSLFRMQLCACIIMTTGADNPVKSWPCHLTTCDLVQVVPNYLICKMETTEFPSESHDEN